MPVPEDGVIRLAVIDGAAHQVNTYADVREKLNGKVGEIQVFFLEDYSEKEIDVTELATSSDSDLISLPSDRQSQLEEHSEAYETESDSKRKGEIDVTIEKLKHAHSKKVEYRDENPGLAETNLMVKVAEDTELGSHVSTRNALRMWESKIRDEKRGIEAIQNIIDKGFSINKAYKKWENEEGSNFEIKSVEENEKDPDTLLKQSEEHPYIVSLIKEYSDINSYDGRAKASCIFKWWRKSGGDGLPEEDWLGDVEDISEDVASERDHLTTIRTEEFEPLFNGAFEGTRVDPRTPRTSQLEYNQTLIHSLDDIDVSPSLREKVLMLLKPNRKGTNGASVKSLVGCIDRVKGGSNHERDTNHLINHGEDLLEGTTPGGKLVRIDPDEFMGSS